MELDFIKVNDMVSLLYPNWTIIVQIGWTTKWVKNWLDSWA